MSKIISIYGGHNASVTFFGNDGNYHVIELERLTQERHYMLFDKTPEAFREVIQKCLDIAKKFWGVENDFDVCCYGVNGATHIDEIKKVLNVKKVKQFDHHLSHAACSFYQSPYQKSLIISYDGGGNDGVFNVYIADKDSNEIKLIGNHHHNLGHAYLLTGYPISELQGVKGKLPYDLSIAGKLMGLVARGTVRQDWLEPMREFYRDNSWNFEKLSSCVGKILDFNSLKGQDSFDFAATSQQVFEEEFYKIANEALTQYSELPLCLAGGCALNVLLNEKIREVKGDNLFIPPNPDDGGLSLGQMFLHTPPKKQVDVTFSGLPILDLDFEVSSDITKKPASLKDVVKYIVSGKIIGVIDGDSEVGPRALGNRSIICDPSFPNMKDTLNHKVKFREWFRPFAPVVRHEDSEKFFELDAAQDSLRNFKFMSFAPRVKNVCKDDIPAIVHSDGTARLQVVFKEDSSIFFKILTEMAHVCDHPVILNTSFNIRGKPILSKIQDAVEVLRITQLDAVYHNGYMYEYTGKKVQV
jgi:carbamoyltransferase